MAGRVVSNVVINSICNCIVSSLVFLYLAIVAVRCTDIWAMLSENCCEAIQYNFVPRSLYTANVGRTREGFVQMNHHYDECMKDDLKSSDHKSPDSS